MAVIAEVLSAVDSTASSVGGSAFGEVATAVVPVFRIGAVLAVALTGVNLAIQAIPMTLRNGLSLVIRIAVVWIFLSSFDNFNAVYAAISETPSRLGGTVLEAITGSPTTDLCEGLDGLYEDALALGQAVSENGSYISGALTSLALFIVAALMATISIIVICAAKLMIAVLIIVAPLAIVSTLFKPATALFEAWVKLALGFAFVPLLTAAMAGFTIAVSEVIATDIRNASTIGDVIGFVVVMMLGTGLMLMVPTLAQSLAQTSIGIGGVASSTYAQARTIARGAGAGTRGAYEGVTGAGKTTPYAYAGSSNERRMGRAIGTNAAAAVRLAVALAQKSAGQRK